MARGMKRIAVTGGAGQIAYSMLFRIAAGEMLGLDQPVALHILEIPEVQGALHGVKMELEDSAFPLLKEIRIGTDAREVFGDVDYALLVGAKPRGPGMERKDLLLGNGKIFVEQGQALNESASRGCKVLVVGNPCNTNCLIAMSNAPNLSRENFHAMTRLDEMRAITQLAIKSGTDITEVSNMIIWGNHSATQVPDYFHATIRGRPVGDVIRDASWLEHDFVATVQKRGAAIIAARGKSSAASAASAAIATIRSLTVPTPKGHWFSSGVCSDGNPYGFEENLIFSMPCRSKGDGNYEVVKGFSNNDFIKNAIGISEKELIEERTMVEDLCATTSH